MQEQINNLTKTLDRYISQHERESSKIFEKLDEAANERKTILIQTTRTNGRVNRLEDDACHHAGRLDQLEAEQRDTLTFKGKVGIVITVIVTIACAVVASHFKVISGG